MGHKKFKMGFYYNQPQGFYYNQQQQPGFYYNQQQPGFYYNQQPGFYYNQQQGFYYDQWDAAAKAAAKKGFGEAWKKDKYASKVMDSVIDRASKLLTAHFVRTSTNRARSRTASSDRLPANACATRR